VLASTAGAEPAKPAKHPIDRTKPASIIVEKFSGIKRFCEATGYKLGTVHRWLVKGYIDGKYHAHILGCAKAKRIKLGPIDFVDRIA
jgi:hypothetical protein